LKSLRVVIGLVVSAVFLFVIFRAIDLKEVADALLDIQIIWIPLAIVIYFVGIWVRTARWGTLMKPVKKCPTKRFFPIYVISYMANNIFPLRIGDIYRAYIVGKKEDVSKAASLVTIGVERIFDGLTMLLLLFVSFIFFPVEDPNVKLAIQISAAIFLSALIVCYIIVFNKSWANWIFTKILLFVPEKLHPRLKDIFENFFKGLDSLRGARDISIVFSLSILTWLIEAVSYMAVLRAFGFFGGFHVAVSTMALVNLMIIVPAAPGYFGPFEGACLIILGKSGYGEVTQFNENIAAAYALVLHVVVQWIPSTLLGLFYMWKEHLSFKEISSDADNPPDQKKLNKEIQ